ncbi:MAG: hypothetical protein R3183_01565 [Oleiphilaceae bacterium]|nr:hypothetical protein [Oleiphilaceae bacterium]
MKRQKIDGSLNKNPRRVGTLAIQILALLLSVALFHHIDAHDYFWVSVKDCGHVIVFFQGCLLALSLLTPWIAAHTAKVWVVALACFLLGLVIELVQPAFGRNASFLDAWYNLLGVSSAALLFLQHRQSQHRKRLLAIAAIVFAAGFIQPALYSGEYFSRAERLPQLVDFTSPWHRLYWQANGNSHGSISSPPSQARAAHNKALKLDFLGGQYPGVRLFDFWPDWQSGDSLTATLWLAGNTPRTLHVRMHDREHKQEYRDRYNRTFTLHPGLNILSIALTDIQSAPETRKMDLSKMEEIGLFTVQPERPMQIYLMALRLEEPN